MDLRAELENFPPINLEKLESSGREIPDNIRNSIILYNKALESLRSKSEDIAIIELKKAISMNPSFYEAMNLLGLCYSYLKDNAKAAEMFERVIAAENNGVKALKYLNNLNDPAGSQVQAQKSRKKIRTSTAARTSMAPMTSMAPRSGMTAKKDTEVPKDVPAAEKFKIILKRDILKYLAGFAAGALLVFLVTTAVDRPVQPQVDNTENEAIIAQLKDEINSYKSKYDNLSKEHEDLQKSLEAANAGIAYYKSVAKLYEAETLYVKKDYEAAGDLLLLLKAVEFNEQDKAKFDELMGKVMPLAAQVAYEQGRSLVNPQGKYEEALAKLQKVELFQPDFDRMDAVLYYIGKSYQALNDSRNAIAAYQKILELYPRSSYVQWVHVRMREITQVP